MNGKDFVKLLSKVDKHFGEDAVIDILESVNVQADESCLSSFDRPGRFDFEKPSMSRRCENMDNQKLTIDTVDRIDMSQRWYQRCDKLHLAEAVRRDGTIAIAGDEESGEREFSPEENRGRTLTSAAYAISREKRWPDVNSVN